MFERKIVNIFLLVLTYVLSTHSISCSSEYPQHMFWLRNKKIIFFVRTLNLRPAWFYVISGGGIESENLVLSREMS